MTGSVVALPGCRVPHVGGVRPELVLMLRDLLARAEDGSLQSFVGVGFVEDGGRLAAWGDLHPNVYEMAGSIAWLQAEYIHRHTEPR